MAVKEMEFTRIWSTDAFEAVLTGALICRLVIVPVAVARCIAQERVPLGGRKS